MLHSFYVRDAIIAGSTGRIVMILLIYGAPFIGLPNIDIISMLGSIATASKQAAVTLGGAVHFTMSIIFALIYAALWSLGIGRPIWWWGLIFGAIHGILVLLLLALIMIFYPRLSQLAGRSLMIDSGAAAPRLPSLVGRSLMVSAVLINHMAYGLVVALVYSAQK